MIKNDYRTLTKPKILIAAKAKLKSVNSLKLDEKSEEVLDKSNLQPSYFGNQIPFLEDQAIYNDTIRPTIEKFREVLGFANDGVSATQEKPGSTDNYSDSWTKHLIKDDKIGSSSNKHTELERTLSSVVYCDLFLYGSMDSYHKLISVQKPEHRLSINSFNLIYKLAISMAEKYGISSIKAMLVYSDLGKIESFRKAATEFSILCLDHDNWIEEVLKLGADKVTQIIPSFGSLSVDEQLTLNTVAKMMKVHFGHVLHLEGGKGMFAQFEEAIKSHHFEDKDILDLAILLQLCDVAAAAGQVTNKGSLTLTENCYQGYMVVYRALKMIMEGATSDSALNYCVMERSKTLGLKANDNIEAVLIRISCMLRFYDNSHSQELLIAYDALDEESKQLLLSQFDLTKGFNSWDRNPTYLPAVLLNLHKATKSIQYTLNGAVCIGHLLQQYGQVNSSKKDPLNFNVLAGLAANNPEIFTNISKFNVEQFEINDKNEYKLKTPTVLSLVSDKKSE